MWTWTQQTIPEFELFCVDIGYTIHTSSTTLSSSSCSCNSLKTTYMYSYAHLVNKMIDATWEFPFKNNGWPQWMEKAIYSCLSQIKAYLCQLRYLYAA